MLLALLRLVEAQSGSITVDGVDTREMGLEDLRGRFSIIPQVCGLCVCGGRRRVCVWGGD